MDPDELNTLETELPVLELVDGTAEDRVSSRSCDLASLSWFSGSEAFVARHRRFLLVTTGLLFLIDAALYSSPAPVLGELLDGNSSRVDVRYGLVFAAGPAVSLIVMPLATSCAVCVGPIETVFPAFGILAASALLIGLAAEALNEATQFAMLIAARSLSGIGTGLARSGVPAVISAAYDSEDQRNAALSSALLGLGVGETLGPAYAGGLAAAGVTLGWKLAFYIICATSVCGCVMAFVGQYRLAKEGVRLRVPVEFGRSSLSLIRDSHILVICAASFLAESAVSLIPAVLVPWLRSVFASPSPWQLGLLLTTPNLSYLIVTPLLVLCHVPQGQSHVTLATASLLAMALSLCALPFVPKVHLLFVILPLSGLGVGAAMLDLCLLPVLSGRLAARYAINQNTVYKFQNFTLATAFTVGPLIGTLLATLAGYDWTFFHLFHDAAGLFADAVFSALGGRSRQLLSSKNRRRVYSFEMRRELGKKTGISSFIEK